MRCLLFVAVLAAVLMSGIPDAGVFAADPAPAPTISVRAADLISDARSHPPIGDTITIVGARNGVFSGRAVVESTGDIQGLKGSAGMLRGEAGEIAAEDIRVRYAVAFDGSWKRRRPGGLDVLLESPPETVAAGKSGAIAAVWVTVDVPANAPAGRYTGQLTVEAEGLEPTAIPVELTVADWTLPDPQDYRTWVGMIQSPDSLAMEYEVELWSEAHWQLIARSFERMSGVGCRNVFVPLLARTNFGNEQSMVRWVRKPGGGFDYDFSIMERYLDLAEQYLGMPKMVVFQSWEVYLSEKSNKSIPFHLTEEAKAGRKELQGKGPRVTVVDPETGETELHYLPRFGDPASEALWRPLFDELHRRMERRGLEDTMMLGVVSDVWPSKEDVAFLNEVSGGLAWASHAHPGRLKDHPPVGNKILHGIADLGYEAHVYDLDYQVDPAKGRMHGWRKPQLDVRFGRNGATNSASTLQMRLMPAFNITGGQRGIGRFGADVWYITRNRRGQRAGTAYHRYPEVNWRNLDIESWALAPGPDGPVSTARLESLHEGIEECEARITIESALLDPAARKLIGEDLVARCQTLLDERQHALWRTIWSNEDDLALLGHIRARHPIEAVWGALTKQHGKELPGYWDGEARKLRRDEAAKGREWFAASGWQERNEKLFGLAGEVARALDAGSSGAEN